MVTTTQKTQEMKESGSSSEPATEIQQKQVPSARWPEPFEQMERMFEEFSSRGWLHPFRWEWPSGSHLSETLSLKSPHIDIIDRDEEILIRAEIPGIDKKDLDISMSDQSITIKGSSRTEKKEEKGAFYHHEIRSGEFCRTLSLPSVVDADKARASCKDGLLEITMPKRESSRRHTITID